MFRRTPVAVFVLAAWTLLVWSNRIYNIASDSANGDGLDLARAIAFVLVGIAVAAVALVPTSPEIQHRVVSVAGWASIVLWATRIVTIPMGDHETSFVVVHLVLAAISIGLALWAMSSTRSPLATTNA